MLRKSGQDWSQGITLHRETMLWFLFSSPQISSSNGLPEKSHSIFLAFALEIWCTRKNIPCAVDIHASFIFILDFPGQCRKDPQEVSSTLQGMGKDCLPSYRFPGLPYAAMPPLVLVHKCQVPFPMHLSLEKCWRKKISIILIRQSVSITSRGGK